MNTHQRLLDTFPTAGRLSAETGIPVSTAKYWKRTGHIHDPSRWSAVWEAATRRGWPYSIEETAVGLAEDYNNE